MKQKINQKKYEIENSCFKKMHFKSLYRQEGVSLLVVIGTVFLSAVLVLWGNKTAIFNELFVTNDVDYQRTFEAANIVLEDAELDVLSKQPNGDSCRSPADPSKPRVCRQGNGAYIIPRDEQGEGLGNEWWATQSVELEALREQGEQAAAPCRFGVCIRRPVPDFWNDPVSLEKMKAAGARYGEYTGAVSGHQSNPIVKDSAWYWVEISGLEQGDGITAVADPEDRLYGYNGATMMYRITVLAQGQKPGTRVVLQKNMLFEPTSTE